MSTGSAPGEPLGDKTAQTEVSSNPYRLAASGVKTNNAEDATEETPLLANNEVNEEAILPDPVTVRHVWPYILKLGKDAMDAIQRNRIYAYPIGAAVVWFVATVSILIFKTEDIIQTASEIGVSDLSITNITNTGLTAVISGTMAWNYSEVSWILKGLYYPLFFILGRVTLNSSEPIIVFLSLPQSTDKHIYNPVTLHIDPVELDFSPFEETLFQQIPVNIDIHAFDAAKVYNAFMIEWDVNGAESVEVAATLKSKMSLKKGVSLGGYNADIHKKFMVTPGDHDLPDYSVDKARVAAWNSTLFTRIDVGIEKMSLSIDVTIPKVQWDVYIPGCQQSLVYAGTAISSGFEVKRMHPVTVSVRGQFPKLNKSLQKFCEDGFSPINTIAKKLLEDTATVAVKARPNSEINEELPTWLFELLTNTFQPVHVDIRDILEPNPTDDLDYQLFGANMMIANDAEVLPQVNGDAQITHDLPITNQDNTFFDLKGVFGDFCFVYDDEVFLKVYLHSWQAVHTVAGVLGLAIRGAKVDIENWEIASELILRYLRGETLEIFGMAMLDLDIKTVISDTIFQRMPHNFTISVEGDPGLVEDVGLTINDLTYIDTTTDSQLRFFVNMEVANLMKVGGGVQFLNLLMNYNGTTIGNIELADTVVESGSTTNVTSIIRFKADDDNSRKAINDVISDYISGREPEIIVTGHKNSCKNPLISNILSDIDLPFKAPSSKSADGDSEGYILSSTFHVLSSEVQVTVYNPIKNKEVSLYIKKGKTMYEDIDIAYIPTAPVIRLPPGISTTQRIPVKIAAGAAKDLLKKSLNSNLTLHTAAEFDLIVGEYLLSLNYEGQGVDTIIRLQ